MRLLLRLTTTALATTLLLTLTATGGSARNLRVSNQRIRVTWRRLEFIDGETVIMQCPLTLEGSFHSTTIAKVRGSLIGYITHSAVSPCSSGRVTILRETLPWHVTYESFRGILPNITSIRLLLVRLSYLTEFLGFRCLTQTTTTSPASMEAFLGAGGRVEALKLDETVRIPVRGGLGGFGCPSSTTQFRTEAGDPGTVTLLGNNTAISITLI